MYKVHRSEKNNYVEVLNLYSVYVSNHKHILTVAAHNFYEACDKVNRLIKSWETSSSHEILSISLFNGSIIC